MVAELGLRCPKWLAEAVHCTLRRWDSRRRLVRSVDRNWDRLWVDSRRFGREANSTYPVDAAGRGSSRRQVDRLGNAFGGWDGRTVGRGDQTEEDLVRSDRMAVSGLDL